MLAIEKSQKNRKKYECKYCDYITCNKCDFYKHNATLKHQNNCLAMENGNLAINLSQKSQKITFVCELCNRVYKDNSGLWRHKKNVKQKQIMKLKYALLIRQTNNMIRITLL